MTPETTNRGLDPAVYEAQIADMRYRIEVLEAKNRNLTRDNYAKSVEILNAKLYKKRVRGQLRGMNRTIRVCQGAYTHGRRQGKKWGAVDALNEIKRHTFLGRLSTWLRFRCR